MSVPEQLKASGLDFIYCTADRYVVFRRNSATLKFRLFETVVRSRGSEKVIADAKRLLEQRPQEMEEDPDYDRMLQEHVQSMERLVAGHCEQCTRTWNESRVERAFTHNDYAEAVRFLCSKEFCVSTRYLFPADLPIVYDAAYQATVRHLMSLEPMNAFIAFEYWENGETLIYTKLDGPPPPGVPFILEVLDIDGEFEPEIL